MEMDADKKRAIHGRKGAEMSVFGTTLPTSIGAYRGGAAAADRPKPTVATESTHPKKYAQLQFSSPYNNLYEPHICDWAYIQYIFIQGPCTQLRPFRSPTRIQRDRLFYHADILNGVSNAEHRSIALNVISLTITLSNLILFHTTHPNHTV